jgi:hypothetical protein
MLRHRVLAGALTAAVMGSVAAGPASAEAKVPDTLKTRYTHLYNDVKDLGGKPGRNIVRHGLTDHKPATIARVRESMDVLSRMKASMTPAPAAASNAATAAPAASNAATAAPAASAAPVPTPQVAASAPSSGLQSIAQCESGGNPAAVDASGTYRGKYQFDQGTWESVGGTGDPAAAPESVQDSLAAKLQAQRGNSPWPVCGR